MFGRFGSRGKQWHLTLLFMVILFLPLHGLCNEPGRDPISHKESITEKNQVFDRITQTASGIETLSSDFTQETHSAMLKDVPVAKGRFFYRCPDGLRWEVLEPNPRGFVVNGEKAKRWRGQYGHSQSFDLRRESVVQIITDQVFAWARADFNWLEDRYTITVEENIPAVLKLIPVSSSEKKYVDHIRLIFSPTDTHLSVVEIHQAGGDFTVIRFINTAVNSPLDEHFFE
jgi:outer membrane lipoprotein-sorting protein